MCFKNFYFGFLNLILLWIELKNNNLKEIFNANKFIKIRLNLSGKQDVFLLLVAVISLFLLAI
ncbi:hypothetical protein CHL9004_00005 [Campylobacter hyointestinalis subsp. lawsonii]|nr:hypothetical protein CHL9004_00005 [Campylobacter hyointestinalis subsp. lawsonii]